MNMKTYIELIDAYKKYQKIVGIIETSKNNELDILLYSSSKLITIEGVEDNCLNLIAEYYADKMIEIENKLGATEGCDY